MTIAITGASGQLGRLVVESLLERGVTPIAVVRDPAKVADLAARGVEVRVADYSDPAALAAAFAGVDRLLLVSSSAIGHRIPQHTNVIDAAKAAGVGFVAYTSIPHADDSPLRLAAEHKATEELLAASGLPHAFLRNGWYWENYAQDLAGTVERGVLVGAAGEGRVAGAARADYAAAAAEVLATDGHEGAVYELGGERLTYADLAAVVADVAGKPVVYRDLPEADYAAVLEQAGVPAEYAAILADSDAGAARGGLDVETGHLQKLIGREATSAADVFRATLG